MIRTTEINEKWIKASIIGTIWAASEIVLGSFLHNLRIPFSSNVLTAIGIIVLISTSYKWSEKGLFWRAGLICALMKTMSPSAIIFGPMIAIFSQSLLLEIFTSLLGRNILGFAVGAMFAMTWNLFQKIFNFIIFYGFNIVSVYTDLLKWAQKQLHLNIDLVWSPILVLALLYCFFGLVAAVIGIKVGRRLIRQMAENKRLAKKTIPPEWKKAKQPFNYSLLWLILDLLFIIGGLVALNISAWYVWSPVITAIVVIWIVRYKRALRQLSRPRFWLYFVIITMVTAFVLNKIQSQDFNNGLLVGIQMNFRAVLIILGFSVLGTELYNPGIRDFFSKTALKQLPLALELSFDSLPRMIAVVPDFKVIIRNPVSVIFEVLSQIDYRLSEVKRELATRIFFITGSIGEGKTTQVQKISEALVARNIPVSGVYSPRIMSNGQTIGYDIVDVETNRRETLLRISGDKDTDRIGRYRIFPEGFGVGLEALKKSVVSGKRIVLVDEIGKLELDRQGWSETITELVQGSAVLVFAVRDSIVDQVIENWNLKDYSVFKVSDNPCLEVSDKIANRVN